MSLFNHFPRPLGSNHPFMPQGHRAQARCRGHQGHFSGHRTLPQRSWHRTLGISDLIHNVVQRVQQRQSREAAAAPRQPIARAVAQSVPQAPARAASLGTSFANLRQTVAERVAANRQSSSSSSAAARAANAPGAQRPKQPRTVIVIEDENSTAARSPAPAPAAATSVVDPALAARLQARLDAPIEANRQSSSSSSSVAASPANNPEQRVKKVRFAGNIASRAITDIIDEENDSVERVQKDTVKQLPAMNPDPTIDSDKVTAKSSNQRKASKQRIDEAELARLQQRAQERAIECAAANEEQMTGFEIDALLSHLRVRR